MNASNGRIVRYLLLFDDVFVTTIHHHKHHPPAQFAGAPHDGVWALSYLRIDALIIFSFTSPPFLVADKLNSCPLVEGGASTHGPVKICSAGFQTFQRIDTNLPDYAFLARPDRFRARHWGGRVGEEGPEREEVWMNFGWLSHANVRKESRKRNSREAFLHITRSNTGRYGPPEAFCYSVLSLLPIYLLWLLRELENGGFGKLLESFPQVAWSYSHVSKYPRDRVGNKGNISCPILRTIYYVRVAFSTLECSCAGACSQGACYA